MAAASAAGSICEGSGPPCGGVLAGGWVMASLFSSCGRLLTTAAVLGRAQSSSTTGAHGEAGGWFCWTGLLDPSWTGSLPGAVAAVAAVALGRGGTGGGMLARLEVENLGAGV